MVNTATDWLQPLPPAARLILCGDDSVQAAAATAIGLPFPLAACRAASAGEHSVLWLGPDERLLLAPAARLPELIATLSAALSGHAHSLVDVSQRQIAFEMRGPQATQLLNSQCPLDLALAAFPVGMCTRTVYAKAEIVLWRTAAETFHVEVWRSFADYVLTLLHAVARELSTP